MIAFDTAIEGTATSTSLTYAHTCTGTNLVLIVFVFTYGIAGRDSITGVTYNGVAMTQVPTNGKQQSIAGDQYGYCYYLVNPASGANNVVVSMSESATIRGLSLSYTGVKQTGQPDASGKKTTQGTTSITNAVTTVADNSWLVVGASGHDVGAPVASTGVTSRYSIDGVTMVGDSGAAITPAGSFSQTLTSGSNEKFNMLQISISPILSSEFFALL